jgi:hypothetical protein
MQQPCRKRESDRHACGFDRPATRLRLDPTKLRQRQRRSFQRGQQPQPPKRARPLRQCRKRSDHWDAEFAQRTQHGDLAADACRTLVAIAEHFAKCAATPKRSRNGNQSGAELQCAYTAPPARRC